MNVNPISNFLLNTKIIMNMGSDKYVINIIDLNSNEIDEIEKTPNKHEKINDTIDHLGKIYVNKIISTDMYKKIAFLVSDEGTLISSIYEDIKEKLKRFKYLILYHNKIHKLANKKKTSTNILTNN